jgi:recombination protein RecT
MTAEAQGTALAAPQTTQLEPFRALFRNEAVLKSLAQVAPKHLTPDRITKIALSAISRNPTLLQCTQSSILKAVMAAAELGLEPGGILGHAYLVPFWNTKAGKGRGAFECVLITGYRGKVELARRSGVVASLMARVVFEKDKLEYELGLDERLRHVPFTGAGDPGPMTHVYAIAVMKDGTKLFDVMTAAQVEAIHQRSQSYRTSVSKGWKESGPWVTDSLEMARKTVVHRLCKYLPLAPDKPEHTPFLKAQAAEDRAESGDGWTGNPYGIDPDDDGELEGEPQPVVQGTATALDEAAQKLGGEGQAATTPAPTVDQDGLLDALTADLLKTDLPAAQAFAHNERARITQLDAKHRESFAFALKAHQEKLRNGTAEKPSKGKGRGKKAEPDQGQLPAAAPAPARDGLLPGQCDACFGTDGSHKPGCPNE